MSVVPGAAGILAVGDLSREALGPADHAGAGENRRNQSMRSSGTTRKESGFLRSTPGAKVRRSGMVRRAIGRFCGSFQVAGSDDQGDMGKRLGEVADEALAAGIVLL